MINLFVLTTSLLIVSTNLCLATDPLAQEYGELVFVSLIFRHGDRALAFKAYPNDPYKNASYWPMGFGQLTNQGKRRHYDYGKWLRNRYSEFLPVHYSNDDIYIQSTNVDRVLMSASANLAGLYTPNEIQQWNDELGKLWQPIPIHTSPSDKDTVLSAIYSCPKYKEEYENLKNLPEIQKFNDDHKELYDYVIEHSGLKLNDRISDTADLYDTLLVETQFNLTLPDWTNSVFPEKMEEVAKLSFRLPTYTQNMKKLVSGPVLQDIVTHIERKLNGTLSPNVKLWMYSAHDTNIAALLNSLDVFNNKLPPYASSVILELRKKINFNNTYVVTMLYRNTSDHEPYLLHVPGCDSIDCDLDQFKNAVKPILLTDWNKECLLQNEHSSLIAYIGFALLLLFIVVFGLLVYYKNWFRW